MPFVRKCGDLRSRYLELALVEVLPWILDCVRYPPQGDTDVASRAADQWKWGNVFLDSKSSCKMKQTFPLLRYAWRRISIGGRTGHNIIFLDKEKLVDQMDNGRVGKKIARGEKGPTVYRCAINCT